MLSKDVSSTIFKVFGMTQHGIELSFSQTIGEVNIIVWLEFKFAYYNVAVHSDSPT